MAARVSDLVAAMESIAPAWLAAPWDNVGLLVGDPKGPLSRVLLTVDCTLPVIDEAIQKGCDAIVSYHPPIFAPQKRFVAGSVAFALARAGVAVHSPHTALDAAEGGTNDILADAIDLRARTPLRSSAAVESHRKLVSFVPPTHVETLSRALFEAGAGRIGNYASCSFRTPGTGTFFGEEGARPSVGQAGCLEEVFETRLEVLVPIARVGDVVRALRAHHPYEEPAFDLICLAPAPSALGFGRVGTVSPSPVRAQVDQVKRVLGIEHVLVVGSLDREATRAAVCAGSGGDLVSDAIAAGVDLFLTGELHHHDALRAAAAGLTVVCTLHSVSERCVLVHLQRRLAQRLGGVDVVVSEADLDPFRFA